LTTYVSEEFKETSYPRFFLYKKKSRVSFNLSPLEVERIQEDLGISESILPHCIPSKQFVVGTHSFAIGDVLQMNSKDFK